MSDAMLATVEFKSAGPTATTGILKVDGVDISSFSRGITIDADVDSMTRVDVHLVARRGIDVVLPASVSFHVMCPPRYEVILERQADGSTRYRAQLENGR